MGYGFDCCGGTVIDMDKKIKPKRLAWMFWNEQYAYMEGEPSIWGWWNRMAEYLFSFSRRFYHV